MEVSMGGFVVRLYEQTFNFPETVSVGFDLKCTPMRMSLHTHTYTQKAVAFAYLNYSLFNSFENACHFLCNEIP